MTLCFEIQSDLVLRAMCFVASEAKWML